MDQPSGVVYVGRGSGWGNPFDVREHGHDGAAERYRERLLARPRLVERARLQFAGRRLACWCSLRVACHADVLLELVNEAGHLSGGLADRARAVRAPIA